ncbi:MAG: hypothetical protein HKN33_10550 [Pyrinomonadaceae bacterium]|nr:hypothetical protein [Pyrinomonadaceae bacterium]
MKIRISGNSLRLRLSVSEVEEFERNGRVNDSVQFGLGTTPTLTYSLRRSEAIGNVNAEFYDNQILISIPAAEADEWARTDTIGITATQGLNGSGILRILIEKDFVCLNKRPHVDETDLYPHPNAQGVC